MKSLISRRLLPLLLLAFLATLPAAHATIIVVPGHVGDGTVDVNGLAGSQSRTELRAGVGGNNVRGIAPIFFFALPNVPSPSAILDVQLNIEYLGFARGSSGVFGDPEFNIDLFGLGARSTPTILNTDYHDGHASLSSDTLIEEEFLTPTTATGSLQASGGILRDFVRSLYQPDGTPTAAYVVFRTNPDAQLPPFSGRLRGYELASADNADESLRPSLQVTVVPEPGAIAIWGVLFVVGIGTARRRMRYADHATDFSRHFTHTCCPGITLNRLRRVAVPA